MKTLYALVESDYDPNEEAYNGTAALNSRGLYVHERDAELALNELTLHNVRTNDLSDYVVTPSDLCDDPEALCEDLNHRYGPSLTFAPETLAEDLTVAFKELRDEQVLKILSRLRLSFGQVVETTLSE